MTKAMTLRLPDEIHEALRQQAFNERTSINALVVRAVSEGRKPGTLCDSVHCWNKPTVITSGGFHWCDAHAPIREALKS